MEDFFKQGLKIAATYLERGDRFESEIYLKLKTKGFNEDIINQVLIYLKEKKFLDDERVLKNVIEYRATIKKEGKFKIIQNLMKRGVDRDKITGALEHLLIEDTVGSAVSCLEKKFKNEFDRSKAYRFLGGRGYDYIVIEQALNQFEAHDAKL